MNLLRTMLRPVAFAAGAHAAGQVRAFLAAHRRTREVQENVLRDLLACHADSAFGRDHGLARVRTYEDFCAAVPVGSYETLSPYIRRVLEGDSAALLPPGQDVLMFSMTSGTTGQPKFIPVTARFAEQMRTGWNIFGRRVLGDHPSAWLRAILQISSSPCEAHSPLGKPCGAISGLLAQKQKWIVRRMYVGRDGLSSIRDPEARFYSILRCGVGRDVAFITTANPSSTIKLIETGDAHHERLLRDVAEGTFTPPGEVEPAFRARLRFRPDRRLARRIEAGIARDGRLLPRHFWNLSFLANWTGGTLQLYLPRLRDLFGDVPVRDIGLLASEGRFSIPIADHTSAGLAEITGNFLEFLPVDQAATPAARPLRAHEVQVGAEYFLIVTNWAGLWRYNMDDRVRVVDKFGQSPVFEFLSRGLHTANITGEKLTEHQAVEAMRRAAQKQGAAVQRFVLQGHFAAMPYYEVRLEGLAPAPAQALAQRLDEELAALNVEYHSKRSSGRLGPVRATLLPEGTLEAAEARAIADRRGRSEQYKHKYLATDIVRDA